MFWCLSSRDALTFAHPSSLTHCIVFFATLGTCHLSLGVWTNILSACLFVFICCSDCFLSVYIRFCLHINFFIFVAMLLIGHNLHHNCGLNVISMFNLFEHCILLEILVFDSCVGLERLHLLINISHAH